MLFKSDSNLAAEVQALAEAHHPLMMLNSSSSSGSQGSQGGGGRGSRPPLPLGLLDPLDAPSMGGPSSNASRLISSLVGIDSVPATDEAAAMTSHQVGGMATHQLATSNEMLGLGLMPHIGSLAQEGLTLPRSLSLEGQSWGATSLMSIEQAGLLGASMDSVILEEVLRATDPTLI